MLTPRKQPVAKLVVGAGLGCKDGLLRAVLVCHAMLPLRCACKPRGKAGWWNSCLGSRGRSSRRREECFEFAERGWEKTDTVRRIEKGGGRTWWGLNRWSVGSVG